MQISTGSQDNRANLVPRTCAVSFQNVCAAQVWTQQHHLLSPYDSCGNKQGFHPYPLMLWSIIIHPSSSSSSFIIGLIPRTALLCNTWEMKVNLCSSFESIPILLNTHSNHLSLKATPKPKPFRVVDRGRMNSVKVLFLWFFEIPKLLWRVYKT